MLHSLNLTCFLFYVLLNANCYAACFLAKDVAGRLTVPTGSTRNYSHFVEYGLKGALYFEFEKFRQLQCSKKHTRLLAAFGKPLESEVKKVEGSQNELLKRHDGAITTTKGVEEVLHMVGGIGEISYAKNSRIQAKGILRAKPMVEEAVKQVYKNLTPKKFVAADLACSSGPNTFLVISEITSAIDELSRQSDLNQPEIQIFLNDLYGNDFNNIFRSLMDYEKQVKTEKGEFFVPFYVAGSPGSFYTRLFPSKSVHFFHSSYGQMWLSQVPRGVDGKSGLDQMKKENLYLDQFKEDFSTFLKLRSKELISGGRMVLTISGKRKNPNCKDMAYILGLLTVALNDMISEGLLREADQNATNFPFYTPSMEELKSIIQMEGSFHLDLAEIFELSWDSYEDEDNILEPDNLLRGKIVAKYARAVTEPLLDCSFSKEIRDVLFSRYADIIATHLNEKSKWVSFILELKLNE